MDNQSNLYERTKEAAIVYFQLKEQYEQSIIATVKEFRRQCLITWLELYDEYKNKYPSFTDVNVGIPALIQTVRKDIDIERLKQCKFDPYFNFKWTISVYCFIHIDNESSDSEYQDDVKISLDYDDESFVIMLRKTNILDPKVFVQEVEKFKQDTINYFNTSYNSYLQRRKQHIDYLQSKLTQ